MSLMLLLLSLLLLLLSLYCILLSIVHIFYIENDAEIFPVHYTQKVAKKGFKIAFMMNKLAMINSCEIILKNIFLLPKSL